MDSAVPATKGVGEGLGCEGQSHGINHIINVRKAILNQHYIIKYIIYTYVYAKLYEYSLLLSLLLLLLLLLWFIIALPTF